MELIFNITDPVARKGTWTTKFSDSEIQYDKIPNYKGIFLIREGTGFAHFLKTTFTSEEWMNIFDGKEDGTRLFGYIPFSTYFKQSQDNGNWYPMTPNPGYSAPHVYYYPAGVFMPGEYAAYYACTVTNANGTKEDKYFRSTNILKVDSTANLHIKLKTDQPKSELWISDLQYMANSYDSFYISTRGDLGEKTRTEIMAYADTFLIPPFNQTGLYALTTNFIEVDTSKIQTGIDYYAYGSPSLNGNQKVYKINPTGVKAEENIQPPTVPGTFILTTEIYPPNIPDLATVKITPPSGPFEVGTNQEVVVSTPPPGWKFCYWTIDATGENTTTNVVMDRNKTARAVFDKIKYEVNVTTIGSGYTSPSSKIMVSYGDSITLEAFPIEGYEFKEWSGDKYSTNRIENIVDIRNNKNFVATFVRKTASITFKRGGLATCGGTVEVLNLENNEKIIIGTDDLWIGKTLVFNMGANLLITAKGLETTQFEKWSEGAPLKKRTPFNESFIISDTVDTDNEQYLQSVNGSLTLKANFFCRPPAKPSPKWEYSIGCPTPTVSDGSGNPTVPITPENAIPITDLVASVVNGKIKLAWSKPNNARFIVIQARPTAIPEIESAFNTVTLGITDSELLSVSEIIIPIDYPLNTPYDFRMIVYGGLNRGISNIAQATII